MGRMYFGTYVILRSGEADWINVEDVRVGPNSCIRYLRTSIGYV